MPNLLGKLFTPFDKPAIQLVYKEEWEFKDTKVHSTLQLDIEFPNPSISNNKASFDEIKIIRIIVSDIYLGNVTPLTQIQFPEPQMASRIDLLNKNININDRVVISENLFKPIEIARVYGKDYTEEDSDTQKTLPFPEKQQHEKQSQKLVEKSLRLRKERRIPNIWDIIFPLLEPPLEIDRTESFILSSDLYPFQRFGVKFLCDRESALLGDDMGLGKTVQSIIAMRILFGNGKINSALIVVPFSLLKNWERELEKWAPRLKVAVVRGFKESRLTDWQLPEHTYHVYLTTYDTLKSDIDSIEHFFDLVVLDEIQKIKAPKSDRSKAVKSLKCSRRWGLSGTPIENRLEDLVSIFNFIKPKLLRQKNLLPEKAKGLIEPYFLRRKKKDVLPQLPSKTEINQWIELSNEQREAYELAEKEGVVKLNELETITIQHILALITKLKEICNVNNDKSAKLEWILENLPLELLRERETKVIVFSQFVNKYGVDWLAEKLKEYNPIKYKGDMSELQKDEAVKKFQENKNYPLFLSSVKSGGLGLNLTSANFVVHFYHWWNKATSQQAEDRAHRIGQKSEVFVYNLWAVNTIEERIYRILEKKGRLYSEIIDALADDGTGLLSEDEYFSLFDLSKPQKKPNVSEFKSFNNPDDLNKLEAYEFEKLVANLYKAMGYGVKLLGGPHDGGVDIRATKVSDNKKEVLAIQCKRWKDDTVSESVARDLLGKISNEPEYTKGVIVTSSTFTDPCKKFCEKAGERLELIDGYKLCKLIKDLTR